MPSSCSRRASSQIPTTAVVLGMLQLFKLAVASSRPTSKGTVSRQAALEAGLKLRDRRVGRDGAGQPWAFPHAVFQVGDTIAKNRNCLSPKNSTRQLRMSAFDRGALWWTVFTACPNKNNEQGTGIGTYPVWSAFSSNRS